MSSFLRALTLRAFSRRARKRALVALEAFIVATAIPTPVLGGTFTAFGPQPYIRASGTPVTVDTDFTVLDPSVAYTLHVYNGGLENDQVTGELVSSGKVYVNGAELVGSHNFNQNVTSIDVAASLNTSNTISVELKGKPGGVATVVITGEDAVLPTITATVAPSPDSAGVYHEPVTVTFHCNDATSGIQSCSAPVTVSTEGANQVVTGTAVDRAGNTASIDVAVSIVLGAPDADQDGIEDGLDTCPNTPAGQPVDAAGCAASQRDSDDDGVSDAADQCAATPVGEAVNGQGCSASQLDTDGDGVADNADACPGTESGVSVDGNGCAANQRDADADGVSDAADICPATPSGEAVDVQGCSASQRDTDNDGVNDATDQCSATPAGEPVDGSGCSASQRDTDGDGVLDSLDTCPGTQDGATVDGNGCAAAQRDGDSDGVSDAEDQCPATPPGAAVDVVGCASSEKDSDSDGVNDSLDQCASTPAGETVNAQGCSAGQLDADGDGVSDALDLCAGTAEGASVDANGCSAGQLDGDNDGVPDSADQCSATPAGEAVNGNGCAASQLDSDQDGVSDATDACPGTAAGESVDLDGCSQLQGGSGPLPPDPATVAPPLDNTKPTTVFDATAFIYSGSNPIQTGVSDTTIDPKRVSVLRGSVKDRDGNPITGVIVTLLGHPEFGQTVTRTDGVFDMVVNGGGKLTINYQKRGYLPVQRAIQAAWQNYAVAPDVVMIKLDSLATPVALGSAGVQVARGSTVTDADGERTATMIFPANTSAQLVMPDNSVQGISNLTVRATEYTVGETGPSAMPGELPPASGYTYAVELSVDEAIAAGAASVRFSQPVAFYVDNFLNFPVGGIVPAGYYDRTEARWVPSDNGRVIGILTIENGLAQLDVDGSGVAADVATLASLGITDEERAQLANLYPVGKSLWRTPVTHFTPWDCNWPFGPPANAEPPEITEDPNPASDDLDDPNCVSNSIIDCENQTLGQSVDVVGTPFSLNYRSDQLPGRSAAYSLRIPVTRDTIPYGLKHVLVQIEIAGIRQIEQEVPPLPNQVVDYLWTGVDAYGRVLYGEQPARIKIGYVYDAVYDDPQGTRSFGLPSTVAITGSVARQEVALWQYIDTRIGAWDARVQGLGGWTLDIHHAYVPADKTLYLGDGTRRSADKLAPVVTTIAGTGVRGSAGVGGPAADAELWYPQDLAIAPDGSVYVAENANHRISRIGPDGVLTVIAGTGIPGFSGDGGPATSAQLRDPISVALGGDGSLYVADSGNNRIRKISPDGTITTVAGGGASQNNGALATETFVNMPTEVAVSPEGTVYYIDDNDANYRRRIRQIRPDGTVVTSPDVQNRIPQSLAFGSDGSLYFSISYPGYYVYKVTPSGRIISVAGTGSSGFSGDGGLAVNARLSYPHGIAVADDGSVYIADSNNWRVRRVAPDGIISTIIGNGVSPPSGGDGTVFNGDGRIATQTSFSGVGDVAIGPDGALYIADMHNVRVRRSAARFPGFSADDILVASEDGSQIYQFNKNGRHERTLNALTGALIYQFAYDPDNRLTQVTDAYGSVTQILRYGDGQPYAILSPHGQQTDLLVDYAGMLTTITNPAGESYTATYGVGGLMQAFEDPRGGQANVTYHEDGRLARDTNPAGGFFDFARTELANGYEVARTSGEGRTVLHQIQKTTNGGETRTQVSADGTVQRTDISTNGTEQTTAADGHIVSVVEGSDPRFGAQAPFIESIRVTTPSGLLSQTTASRSITYNNPDDLFSIDQLAETTVVNGRTYIETYDGDSRTLTTTTPEGRQSYKTIDVNGRLISESVAGLHVRNYYYDALGRLSDVVAGSGTEQRVVSYTYQNTGWLGAITDSMNRVTYLDRDNAGRVVRQTRPGGLVTELDHDANGNITDWTVPGNNVHSFAFTPIDLESVYDPPNVGVGTDAVSYVYNLDKQLDHVFRADGGSITNNYDGAGRLQNVTTPHGSISVSYESATGRVSSITAPGGVALGFTYDGPLLLGETWSGPVAGSVSHGYNNNFWVVSQSVNGGGLAYGYDNDGLLVQAGAMTLARSPQNGLLVSISIASDTTSYDYNGFGELIDSVSRHGSSTLYQASYVRDDLGRITQIAETVEGQVVTRNYSYDQAGRLEEVRQDGTLVARYSYDANGNRLERSSPSGVETGSYDAQDRLIAYAGSTYQYTQDGELRSVTNGTETTQYDYDSLGNLRHVTLVDGTVIDYLIDGRGRRVGKRVNGGLVRGWLYQDQLNPVAELDGGGNVVARFVYADKQNVPAYMIKGGVTYRIVSDHLGSPRLVVNTADGSVVQRLDYDEFGRITADTSPGFQPFGFAGGLYDQDSSFVRFGARDYDAATGRWTTKDPILFKGRNTNLYAYVHNMPLMFIDSYGLFDIAVDDPGGRSGAAYGGTITVTGDNGQSVTVPGSSWPNPKNPSPGVSPGIYEGVYSPKGHQRSKPGVRVEDGGNVPTNGPNPAQNGQSFANGINIHCGYSPTNRGSAGCITIQPDRCQDVWDVLQPGETGTITIVR